MAESGNYSSSRVTDVNSLAHRKSSILPEKAMGKTGSRTYKSLKAHAEQAPSVTSRAFDSTVASEIELPLLSVNSTPRTVAKVSSPS